MTGIVRCVDKLGRITIPVEWRKLSDTDRYEIRMTDKGILLIPFKVGNKKLCPNCGKQLTPTIE